MFTESFYMYILTAKMGSGLLQNKTQILSNRKLFKNPLSVYNQHTADLATKGATPFGTDQQVLIACPTPKTQVPNLFTT